jgi:hypothetical protein
MDDFISAFCDLQENEDVKLRDFKEVIALWRVHKINLNKQDLGELAEFTGMKHD